MSHNKNDTYLVKNAGKMRRYQITRANSKHFREEYEGGDMKLICYGAPNQNNPAIRNVIMLTKEDAEKKYAHMGLLPLDRERAVIDSDEAPKRGRPAKIDGEASA